VQAHERSIGRRVAETDEGESCDEEPAALIDHAVRG